MTVDATVQSQYVDNTHKVFSLQPIATQKHSSLPLTCLHFHTQNSTSLFLHLLWGFSVCSKAPCQSTFCTLKDVAAIFIFSMTFCSVILHKSVHPHHYSISLSNMFIWRVKCTKRKHIVLYNTIIGGNYRRSLKMGGYHSLSLYHRYTHKLTGTKRCTSSQVLLTCLLSKHQSDH